MSKTTFTFGKISATPTPTSWSQAYNAGALFVVLALEKTEAAKTEPLAGVGKGFLNELEAEFFTLEEKNLTGITNAFEQVITNVPKEITLTSLLAYIKDETLYLLLVGRGSVIMKRSGKIGTLLSSKETSRTVHSASGQLMPQDCIVLATEPFRNLVSDEIITQALALPDTEAMTETVTPHIHKTEEGGACAILFKVEGEKQLQTTAGDETVEASSEPDTPPTESLNEQESPEEMSYETQKAQEKDNASYKEHEKPPLTSSLPSLPQMSFMKGLSHRKKVFLSIAGVLIVILITSIFFTVSNQQANARKVLFNDVYPEAEKNYEEAEGIISLNKIQARRELEEAQSLLAKTDGKFPNGTDEHEKTEALKARVEGLLARLGDSVEVEAQEIPDSENLLLASLKPSDRIAVVEDETSVYFLTEDEIGSIRKASKSEQELVTNDGDWNKPVGFGKFGSNFYVLDRSKSILKLVPSGSDYSVSDYLTTPVNLSDATSMAIDSSIYVLYKNGDIKKFTRGKEEDFSVKGLETPLTSPTQVVTNEDVDSLFILDPKASRIVKISKAGVFEEEYLSSTLQDAKGFSISPDGNTAFVLSGGKIYSLSL